MVTKSFNCLSPRGLFWNFNFNLQYLTTLAKSIKLTPQGNFIPILLLRSFRVTQRSPFPTLVKFIESICGVGQSGSCPQNYVPTLCISDPGAHSGWPKHPSSSPLRSGILDKVIILLEIFNLTYKLIIIYCDYPWHHRRPPPPSPCQVVIYWLQQILKLEKINLKPIFSWAKLVVSYSSLVELTTSFILPLKH